MVSPIFTDKTRRPTEQGKARPPRKPVRTP